MGVVECVKHELMQPFAVLYERDGEYSFNNFIVLDKEGYSVNIFLISPENICCGYSLEAPQQGASDEYSQHMFLWRNKKNINTWIEKSALTSVMNLTL